MGSGASKAKEKYRADDVAELDVGARHSQLPPLDAVKAAPTAVEVRPSPTGDSSPVAAVSPSRPNSWRGREGPSAVPDAVAQAAAPDPAAEAGPQALGAAVAQAQAPAPSSAAAAPALAQ